MNLGVNYFHVCPVLHGVFSIIAIWVELDMGNFKTPLLQRHVVQTPDRTWRMLCVARHSSLRCTSNHIREKPSINEYAPCHWVGSNPSVLSVRQTNHTRAHEGGRKGRQTACARKSRSIVFMCRLPLNMSKLPLHTYRY